MRKSRAYALMAMLKAAYPRYDIDEPTLDVYADALLDLGEAETKLAVEELKATHKFFPTIAEIRTQVMRNRLRLPRAEVAWSMVSSYLRDRHWPENTPLLVRYVTDAMGGIEPGRGSNLGVLRSQFINSYNAYKQELLDTENVGSLRGAPPEELPSGGYFPFTEARPLEVLGLPSLPVPRDTQIEARITDLKRRKEKRGLSEHAQAE